MKPIDALKTKLTSIANSIREKTGTSDLLTLEEMKAGVDYMPSSADDNTFILVDENGNEIPAVLTKNEVDLTATTNDIREGVVAVTDDGVVTGEKEIPSYHTDEGYRIIRNGSPFILPHEYCDYTKLQIIICAYNTTLTNSVAASKVVIYDGVYNVGSTELVATVVKDIENGKIDLGITNKSGGTCILRYFMYKEIY